MTEKFSVDALNNFVNEFKDGKLKPYIKSEPIPEDNDGPVKVNTLLSSLLVCIIIQWTKIGKKT